MEETNGFLRRRGTTFSPMPGYGRLVLGPSTVALVLLLVLRRLMGRLGRPERVVKIHIKNLKREKIYVEGIEGNRKLCESKAQ